MYRLPSHERFYVYCRWCDKVVGKIFLSHYQTFTYESRQDKLKDNVAEVEDGLNQAWDDKPEQQKSVEVEMKKATEEVKDGE